jgi:hypothetical protein
MAANNNKLSEVKKLLDDIAKQYKSLGLTNPFKGVDEATANIKELEAGLKESHKVMKLMDEDAESLTSSFKSIVEEVKSTNTLYSNSTKSLSSMTSIAGKLRDHQQGLNNLSTKQLKSLQSKLKSEEANLKTNAKLLASSTSEGKQREKEIIALDNINGLLKEKESSLKLLDDSLSSSVQKQKEIERSTGVMGGVLKGISKIPILGDVFDANEAVEEMEGHLRGGGSALGAMGKGLKNMGSQIMGGVLNPANMVLGAITAIISSIISADKETGEMAKSLNLSYNEALNTRKELTSIAVASGDSALNTKRLQETLTSVNSELGTSGKLAEGDLKTFTKLREQAGMTSEEIMGMQKYSMAMGGSLEKNTVNFQAQAKALSMSKGVSLNVNNRTKISIQGGAEGLASAAVNAKLMGGNMAQVASIADSLLDFESSIEKELSAELLIGKNLNLEKARTAALNNDMATVAAEITKQAGSAAEFGKMNRIQQEAIASAMGMSADGMADMLVEQEALKSIGQSLNEEEQKAFDLAKEKYGVEEASRMLKSKAQGEGIDGLVDQQSQQQSFNDAVLQMKELFVDIAQNVLPVIQTVLEPILAIFGSIVEGIRWMVELGSTFGKTLNNLTGGSKVLASIFKGLVIGAGLLAGYMAFASLAAIPVVGAALGAVAAATVIGASFAASKQIKDGAIDPKGGLIVSGEKGSIQLDSEDSIIAGTDLGGNKKPKNNTQSQSGGTSVNVDMSQTNALLQQLISVISAGGDVTLDGQKVGNALNLVSYKTQ